MATAENMRAFRAAREELGFKHTSVYVPSSRMAELSMFVDRLKAERMIEIVETCLPTSREIEVLAGRNFADIPDPAYVEQVKQRYKLHPSVVSMCNETLNYIRSAVTFKNLADVDKTVDVTYTQARAVAHTHMASVYAKELNAMISSLEK